MTRKVSAVLAVIFILAAVNLVVGAPALSGRPGIHKWDEGEIETLKGLRLEALREKPSVPSNRYADDADAARLGRKFFFDKRFSGNNKVSCGTCHRTDYVFTDDLPLAHGMGFTARRTMPLAGAAWFNWFFWDGRKDSLWSQALGPIENPVEHGISRTYVIKVILENYRDGYEAVFGPLPEFRNLDKVMARPDLSDPEAYKEWVRIPHEERQSVNRVYANFGKAIGAFVRTIVPGPARFDRYVKALAGGRTGELPGIFSDQEAAGLRLFIGKAQCTNCHTGPLFTNSDFHALGVPPAEGKSPDPGRAEGIIEVLADDFNCLGQYSDAEARQCGELRFIDVSTEKYEGAFKTPSLRNVAERPPYMHAGQLGTIREVLEFYRGSDNPELGHGDLTDEELDQLEAFLGTLNGPIRFLGGEERTTAGK